MKELPTREEVASQLRPRLLGALLIVIAILLLVIALLLMMFFNPGAGNHYARWHVALVALVLLAGYGLLLPGVWKLFVGPGGGLFIGVLKGAAIAAILVGLGFAGLSAAVVHSMATNPVSASSGSGSDWD